MKYLDLGSVDLAKKIVAVLPDTDVREENARILTALVILVFAYGEKMGMTPETVVFGVDHLSNTAEDALNELNDAGVVL